MGRIVTVHSYRGGTGKSNVIANLAFLAASRGLRVGVLDTDFQSPGVHIPLGLDGAGMELTVSDFLFGDCDLDETVYDLSTSLGLEGGKLFVLPSSMDPSSITKVLADGYDVERLHRELRALVDDLELDIMLIDSHPGLNRETMLTTSISHTLVILVRPDQQDYQGTAVLLKVASTLKVPRMAIVANKVVEGMDEEAVGRHMGDAFGQPVWGVLPLATSLMRLGSAGLFTRDHAMHPFSRRLGDVVDRILEGAS